MIKKKKNSINEMTKLYFLATCNSAPSMKIFKDFSLECRHILKTNLTQTFKRKTKFNTYNNEYYKPF